MLCHWNHATDFVLALVAYNVAWPPAGRGTDLVAVSYCCAVGALCFGGWHWFRVCPVGAVRRGRRRQAGRGGAYDGEVGKSALRREALLTAAGVLQAACWHVVLSRLWLERGRHHAAAAAFDLRACGWCVFVTYWRELHFYVVHRAMHPWRLTHTIHSKLNYSTPSSCAKNSASVRFAAQ